MTAYASAEKTVDNLKVAIEIRSYNSRHMDMFFRIPSPYQFMEDKLKELISTRIARGRLEIRLQIEDRSNEAAALEIDEARANALMAIFDQLKTKYKLKDEVTLNMLINAGGIIKPIEKPPKEEMIWSVVKDCALLALEDLEAMRRTEGDFIASDFRQRLDFISDCLEQIKEGSAHLLAQYQQRLTDRIAALTQNIVELDPARVAQEAAFLADRSDISEEITRAASHLNQFEQIMQAPEPAGRKLNFLLQELNREFNTMGSKIGDARIAHLVIDVKSELEKIREQIQNIE
ncbi:MAG: YicC family protein [Deltaproteobacteria bacterium]|jgi:uncharacterized protein (TIGR00255 family)|nr:YicC family protein [Deltaproteobacteria bacterium]